MKLPKSQSDHIIALKVRLVGLFSFDIGEIDALSKVKETVELKQSGTVEYLVRNPRFFDSAASKPLLVYRPTGTPTILEIAPQWSLVPLTHEHAVADACERLVGSSFTEALYLSASGIGLILFAVELGGPLTTGKLISSTNTLVKYGSLVRLSDETIFSVQARVSEWRDFLKEHVCSSRTSYVREYSVVHVLKLDEKTKVAPAKVGQSLYQMYENEWHALSVRTIEDWEDRYPRGSHFDEPNQAISPAGVLKINLRNTIVYEYPYSEVEIRDLYDPVFIETRIWDLLIAAQLQTLQRIIEQYEDTDYSDVSGELLQSVKRSAIKTFNEFDGFYLSTSKRTRNLYEIAHNAFHTRALLVLLKTKVEQLDVILHGIHSTRRELLEAESGRQQRNLLERAQETSDREEASRLVLSVIGVFTGLSFVLSLSSAFKLSMFWSFYLMVDFGVVFLLIYAVARFRRKQTPVTSRTEVRVKVNGSAVEVISKIATTAGSRLHEAILFDHLRAAVTVDVTLSGCLFRVRADLATEVAGFEDGANGVLMIEAIVLRGLKNFDSINTLAGQAALEVERLSGGHLIILEKQIVRQQLSQEVLYAMEDI